MDCLTLMSDCALILIALSLVGGLVAALHITSLAIIRCPYCKSIKTKHDVHYHYNFICSKCKKRFV
jgi:transposase-like protein